MASRMDRYYNSSDSSMERSRNNNDLYKKVHNDSRRGIDSVSSISRANEIDISKLKDIVSDRESFKKERKLKESIGNSELNIDIPSKKFCAWVVSNGGGTERNNFYDKFKYKTTAVTLLFCCCQDDY